MFKIIPLNVDDTPQFSKQELDQILGRIQIKHQNELSKIRLRKKERMEYESERHTF